MRKQHQIGRRPYKSIAINNLRVILNYKLMEYEKIALIEDLVERTASFEKEVDTFIPKMPDTREARIIGNQLKHSVNATHINYVSAKESNTDEIFSSKMVVVIEEADQNLFWLELLLETDMVNNEEIKNLIDVCGDLYDDLEKVTAFLKETTKQ